MANGSKRTLLDHKAVMARNEPRLQPPRGTPDAQALVWSLTVDNLPPDWFASEQIPLLQAYCRHVCRADQIEAALAGLDPLENLEQFDKLAKLAAVESAKIAMHARSMRLTQQARFKPEQAHGHGAAAASAAMAAALDDDFDGLLA